MFKRITVKKDGLYYQCMETKRGIKCGVCLFGLINPFGIKSLDDSCKRCGAKLTETVYGTGFNLKSYSP